MMERITSSDFVETFDQFVETQGNAIVRSIEPVPPRRGTTAAGDRQTRSWLSWIPGRAKKVAKRLVSRSAGRVLKRCIRRMLRRGKWRLIAESLHDEMLAVVSLGRSTSSRGDNKPADVQLLGAAKTVNSSIKDLVKGLPWWFKALLVLLNEFIDLIKGG